MGMAYLVTGGTGLIGSRIVRDLVREGEKVVVYDWLPARSSLERVLGEEEIGSMIEIVQGDVTDLSHLSRTIEENDVATVIHTASLLTIESNADPLQAVKVNCGGTICVFEAARTLGLKKVVWSSSNAALGPPEKHPEEYIPNDAPHYPQDVYGATKSFNEAVADYYFEQHGVDITGIRYMSVYGGGQQGGFFGPIVREVVFNPALGKPGRVPYRDAAIGWTYVDDPARATVMASRVPRTKTGSFSIMGDVRSVGEVADYVRAIVPGADITTLPGGGHGAAVKFDTRPVEEEIGYRPQWSMERGIKQTINMVRREHGLSPI